MAEVHFQSFDSIDDMFEAIEQARKEADHAVKEWQLILRPGDYFVRVGAGNVAIYCEVLDPSADVSELEVEETKAWYEEPHMRNFRFCRAFSIYCVSGELGDVHISTAALQISKENFEAARQHGWKAGFYVR
jgi:hypothetical protein